MPHSHDWRLKPGSSAIDARAHAVVRGMFDNAAGNIARDAGHALAGGNRITGASARARLIARVASPLRWRRRTRLSVA